MGLSLPDYEDIRFAFADGVLTVTLDRPEKRNAISDPMRAGIYAALDLADREDDIRALVFTGAGEAFCSGADLKRGGDTFNRNAREGLGGIDTVNWRDPRLRDRGGLYTLRVLNCLKPVIMAVNGPAVGFGATMLIAADIRLAAPRARFGFVFARRGLVPEGAAAWFLPRLVGLPTALDWVYSGRLVEAEEALKVGFVRSLHAPDELLPVAQALGREIAANTSPVSVALTRQMMWRLHAARHPMEAHRIDSRAIYALGQGPDVKEGVNAFLEKRAPDFPGRVSRDMPPFFPWWPEPEYD